MKVSHVAATAVLAAATLYSVLPAAAGSPEPGRHHHHPHRPVDVDQPLRDLAGRQLLVGTAVDHAAYTADAEYRERVHTEFSSITAENVMKWEVVEPVRGERDYAAADELVAAAKRNGQRVRGHTLVWHNQVPAWLTEGVESGEIDRHELRGILRRHIVDEVSHFRGRIYEWDVVNEAIDDEGNLRDTLWLRELGPGYIADAFRWAHRADPKAKLFLNDYNVEGLSAKSDAYYRLARELLADRVPVHGFGAQGHYGVQYGFHSAAEIAKNFGRFEALGLRTAVTEADVRMVMPTDNVKLQAQAQGFSALLQGCLLSRRCESFTFWGFTDRYSWVPGWFEGEGAATLLDESFQPKPAYREMQAVLALAGR
ncbi:endo-1,4-beta-xylanase [Actinophytocola gossypii]|uniref:Beta-xylanase n=1 Tax=Actinophytocola gossypii TaxID=2812003 RepID=A0ABT2J1Q0_9PSEU|nr:endo-1,4-beta-xylanase [Actinophytocola gossypii]MCT2581524.1 endo-1,4-beta-xylanase [Actinophytocola gossypii]